MKRFISLFTAIIIPAVMLAPVTTKADRTRDEFLTIVERTFNGSFTANSSGELALQIDGQNTLWGTLTSDAIRYGKDLETHQDFALAFDSQPLSTLEPSIPEVGGDFKMGADFFYQDAETFFWTRLRDMGLFINKDNSPDMAIKDIMEGYFELLKFFQNQYILLNLQETINTFADLPDSEQFNIFKNQFQNSLEQMRNPGTTYAQILTVLLDSNFLRLDRNGSTFTLVVNQDAELVDPAALSEIFSIIGQPAQVTEMYHGMLTNESESIREAYAVIAPMIDAEIRFQIGRDRIRFVTTTFNVNYDPSELPGNEEIVVNEPTITFATSVNTSINLTASRISFPGKTEGIDLTKFYRAIKSTLMYIMISSTTVESVTTTEEIIEEAPASN